MGLFSKYPNNFTLENKVTDQGLHATKGDDTIIRLIVNEMHNVAGINPFYVLLSETLLTI